MITDSVDIRVNGHNEVDFEGITRVNESTEHQRLRIINFPGWVGCWSRSRSREVGNRQVARSNNRWTKLGKHVVLNAQVVERHIARVLEYQCEWYVEVLTVGNHVAS